MTRQQWFRKAQDRVTTVDELIRLLLIQFVGAHKLSLAEATRLLCRSASWGSKWDAKYKKKGLKGLKTTKRSGRPPKVPRHVMQHVQNTVRRKKVWTSLRLQELIYLKSGVRLNRKYCSSLLRKWGYTMKVPVSRHVSAASAEEVAKFQDTISDKIESLESEGYTVLVQDEAIFVADAIPRRRVYTRRGVRATCTVSGTHQKSIVYGAISRSGRQFFRQYEKFDAATFVRYLKAAERKFGKIVMIADRAPQHKAKRVKKLLGWNDNIKLIFLPKGSPYLSAIEECWRQSKREILVAPFVSLPTMIKRISRYFRRRRFGLDILKYLLRAPP